MGSLTSEQAQQLPAEQPTSDDVPGLRRMRAVYLEAVAVLSQLQQHHLDEGAFRRSQVPLVRHHGCPAEHDMHVSWSEVT